MSRNSLKKIRETLMMSKLELARKANVSPITITSVSDPIILYLFKELVILRCVIIY